MKKLTMFALVALAALVTVPAWAADDVEADDPVAEIEAAWLADGQVGACPAPPEKPEERGWLAELLAPSADAGPFCYHCEDCGDPGANCCECEGPTCDGCYFVSQVCGNWCVPWGQTGEVWVFDQDIFACTRVYVQCGS